MKKATLVTCTLSVLIANQALGEQLVSPSQGPYVLVFESKDKMAYFTKECAGKGTRTYEPDCVSCVKAMVDSGTRCSVIEKTLTARKVRILGPKFVGKVGWVPREMVD